METARRIYKNTLYLGTAETVSRVLQFVVMLYAARLLSKEHFGKFSFALSLSFIAIVLADMGINTLLIREISRNKENKSLVDKYFSNAAIIKLVLCVITYAIIELTLYLLQYPPETKQIVRVVWAFTILSTFTDLFYSIFRSFEKMHYDASIKILRMILLTAASLYVLFKGYGVLAFSFTFFFVEVAVILVAASFVFKTFVEFNAVKKLRLFDFSFSKYLFKMALPFGLALVFGSIYFYIGSVMLSKIKGDDEVAVYSVAYNIALAVLFIPNVYTNAIYPVLSRYYKESKEGLRTLYERSFKYLYVIGLPISVGLYLLAGRIISLLYGKAYSGSAIALQIISWYLFIKFINFLLGTVLSSIDRQNKRMLGQGLTAVFNVALNLLLIPKIGYVGAAWSTFVTEIFLFVLYYWYVSKSLHAYNFLGILLKPSIAAAAMFLFIKFTNFGLLATILLSAIIYFAVIFASKSLDKKDYEIMRAVFKNGDVRKN